MTRILDGVKAGDPVIVTRSQDGADEMLTIAGFPAEVKR